MLSHQEKSAYERYKLIIALLNEINDKKGLGLVAELVEKCVNYLETVVAAEVIAKTEKFRMEERQLAEEISRLDQRRRLSHEALISQLYIVNRYTF